MPNRYKIDSQFHIQFYIQFHIQRLNLLQDYLLLFGNFTPIPQICRHRATNLDKKHFWRNFPIFQKNLHSPQNWTKNGFAEILKSYPLILWQLIKISVLFHKSTHQALPFWPNRISGKFPNFPEKLTLSAKFGQKWFWLEFEVLSPEYLTVNENFSIIPQIYNSNTTILITKNFWKISQFSSKTYIVCRIGTR